MALKYRKFLKNSLLSPSAKEELMKLAAKRSTLVQQYRDKTRSGSNTTSETFRDFYARESQLYDEQMRTLLESEYDAFIKADQQIPIAQQISIFSQQQNTSGLSLSNEQQDAVVEILWKYYAEYGVDFYYVSGISRKASNRDLLLMLESRKLAERAARNELSQIISSEQVARLKAFQGAQLQGILLRDVRLKNQSAD